MSKLECRNPNCSRALGELAIFLRGKRVLHYDGRPLCSPECLKEFFVQELSGQWTWIRKVRSHPVQKVRLGAILLQTGAINEEQLKLALQLQRNSRIGRLGQWLQLMGCVEERQVTVALSKQSGVPWINLKNFGEAYEPTRLIPAAVARRTKVLAVGYDRVNDAIRLVTGGPVDFITHEAVRRMLQKPTQIFIGDDTAIEALIERWHEGRDEEGTFTFPIRDSEDLGAVGKQIVQRVLESGADNFRAELLDALLWIRMDFGEERRDEIYLNPPDEHDEREAGDELRNSFLDDLAENNLPTASGKELPIDGVPGLDAIEKTRINERIR